MAGWRHFPTVSELPATGSLDPKWQQSGMVKQWRKENKQANKSTAAQCLEFTR
jgi:hypothetical protein